MTLKLWWHFSFMWKFCFGDILVSVTFQFWWHFCFSDFSVLVTFQFCALLWILINYKLWPTHHVCLGANFVQMLEMLCSSPRFSNVLKEKEKLKKGVVEDVFKHHYWSLTFSSKKNIYTYINGGQFFSCFDSRKNIYCCLINWPASHGPYLGNFLYERSSY